jgi:ABC-type Fe3+ transport system permease subunit
VDLLKRWAFLAPLLLLTLGVANQLLTPGELAGSVWGWLLGIALAVPLAVVWDRRRRRGHRWSATILKVPLFVAGLVVGGLLAPAPWSVEPIALMVGGLFLLLPPAMRVAVQYGRQQRQARG